jgi:hypothetical protein
MSLKHWGFTAFAVLATALWLVPNSWSHADEGPDLGQGQEVLTNGPVHEAFAEPTVANPTPSLVVQKQPPEPIEEMPPDVKPDGANVVWVTGYWAWDDMRKEFIWVSGIWRDTPPNHVWVTGYWNQVADGYQWTPGFWSPEQEEQVNYLPEPPQTVESGPTIPQPSPNDFWVPGNWQYRETRYVWRPGYWTVAQPDWIWTPAHYVWTPSGYLFIPGHWDYLLERRGVLFAPVYFSGPFYARRHFVFAPTVVIDSSLLTVNFFVRPHYYHYYFGDCYGDSFVSLGYRPWFSVGVRFGPDPLFAYYSWHHRDDRRWSEGLHEHYTYLHSHPDARPPRTFVQQTTIINNNITINKNSNNKTLAIGTPLNQYVKNTSVAGPNNVKFVNVSNQQRQQLAQETVKSHDFARERARMEGAGGGTAKTGIVGGAKGPGPNLVGPKGTGPGGDKPKSLDLHKLAQTSGAPLPGTTVDGSKTGVTGPGPGTLPGGSKTGITGPGTLPGGSKTGVTGPDAGPGGTKTTGPSTGRPTIVGPGPGSASGPLTGPGAIKGGTGPGTGSKPLDSPKGSSGKPLDIPKGSSSKPLDIPKGSSSKPLDLPKGPTGGRAIGPPPSPAPSDRGKGSGGDPRGKKPDDKKDPNDPRGGGRALLTPNGANGLTAAQNPNLFDDQSGNRRKDAVGPLNVHPGLVSESASARAAANANRAALDSQPPLRLKDPVAPLTIAPRSPLTPARSAGPATGPVPTPSPRNNAEPKTKDPVQPLRIVP